MRKDADFNIEDRIATYYQVSGELEAVFQTWQEYIKAETLTTRLVGDEPLAYAYRGRLTVDGETLVLGVQRYK
jgi:hypothetical protein